MRFWRKLILGIAAIAVLLWLLVRIGGFALDVLRVFNGGSGEHDPMFAVEETLEPSIAPTDDGARFEDNSANWDTSVQTPVEATAEELGEEAKRANE